MSTTATAESHTASTSDPTRAEAQARLTEVHATFGRQLLGYLGQFTAASRQGADDLLQETMIRVWRRIEGLPIERENARRWLFTVARNVGIDAIRRAKARPVVVDLRDDTPAAGGDDTSEQVVALESLREALHALSVPHQRILAELYLQGRSLQETAKLLDLPLGTVKSRAYYALRSIRTTIAAEPADRPRRRPAGRDGLRRAAGARR